jgi:hypothetical protein
MLHAEQRHEQWLKDRGERIVETARRVFEATAAVEYVDSQIRSAFACAEAFEDAADKFRNGVKW